jgi:hypothetical protein
MPPSFRALKIILAALLIILREKTAKVTQLNPN